MTLKDIDFKEKEASFKIQDHLKKPLIEQIKKDVEFF